MAEHNDTGRWGERKAAEYLERKGYRILWKDWRDGHRDIDIVAVDADQLVVVEVKTRRSGSFMPPELAVDARKMRNLAIAATKFAAMYRIDSTNRLLRDYRGEEGRLMTVAVADYQTAGRGQGRSTWESAPGQNLLFSVKVGP